MEDKQQPFNGAPPRTPSPDRIEINRKELIDAAQKNALGYELWEVRVPKDGESEVVQKDAMEMAESFRLPISVFIESHHTDIDEIDRNDEIAQEIWADAIELRDTIPANYTSRGPIEVTYR